ncbi:hypothetical protein P3T39_000755 [Kitasatospora sp. GP82]|nr:hypothetical protein [Kitasatospora sp. GP82]MDH6576081.1 hypothetical protein [Kitasatospora sp. MAP5-34]
MTGDWADRLSVAWDGDKATVTMLRTDGEPDVIGVIYRGPGGALAVSSTRSPGPWVVTSEGAAKALLWGFVLGASWALSDTTKPRAQQRGRGFVQP